MSKSEYEYLSLADDATNRKAPFSAVVYTLLALVVIFRDIRDILREIKEHYDRKLR